MRDSVEVVISTSTDTLEIVGREPIVIEEDVVEIIDVGVAGPPGAQGPTGPQGPPGPGGGSSFVYIHDQTIASTTWVVTHNLNGFPNVTVVDSAGTEVVGTVTYNSDDQITLEFSAPFSGKAYLS